MHMKQRISFIQFLTFFISALVIIALYFIAFYCLNKDLKSIFDEGFFFTSLKPLSTFSAFTRPLSLSDEILQAFFPNISNWDVLSLRRLSYYLKITGLVILIICSIFFCNKQKKIYSTASLSRLVLCILAVSLISIPSVVISSNDELLFCEMIVLSLSLCAVCFTNKWLRAITICLMGGCAFFATLCNAPGGGMLFLLSIVFLCFYPEFHWQRMLKTVLFATIGILLGTVVMHLKVMSLSDCWAFFKEAIAITSPTGTSVHHSLTKLLICILLNIRDLIITVVSLFGITYVSRLLGCLTKKKWMEILAGAVLIFIFYKWQAKPGIGFGNIMTWLFFMTILPDNRIKALPTKDWFLLFYLFLLPFCLSLGSNSGFIFKSKCFIVPWGILLYLMIEMTEEKSPYRSLILYLFVFVLLMMDPGRYLIRCLSRESYRFDKETPIARMHLSKAQYDFYNEVYDVMGDYGYVSQQDTLLGFCFNEMTVVAVDAIPYTNDQYPEEFLQHRGQIPRPSFIILGGWDEIVVSPFIDSLGWRLSADFDSFELKTNPDPESGYGGLQSTLYCLKTRRLKDRLD